MTESETGWVKAPGTARKDGALEKKGTRLLWNESNPCLSLRAYQRFREERRCFGARKAVFYSKKGSVLWQERQWFRARTAAFPRVLTVARSRRRAEVPLEVPACGAQSEVIRAI